MVIEAGGARSVAITLLPPSGECHDHRLNRQRQSADSSGSLDPIHVRHADVHEDELRSKRLRGRNGRDNEHHDPAPTRECTFRFRGSTNFSAAGSQLDQWSGDCSGNADVCTLDVNGPKTITADFGS